MTDVYTDTEYSVTMLAVLAEHRGFVIRKMPLKFGTGGLKMTVYCDYDSCEYYEDGCCYNDRIFLSEIGECESYKQKIEEDDDEA